MAIITSVLKTLTNNVKVIYRALINKAGEEINPATEDTLASGVLGMGPVDLANGGQSATNTHTTKGTAEKISGATAFTAGATLEIVGLDTPVFVGAKTDDATSKTAAETNAVGSPAGVPLRVTLDAALVALHVDAAAGGTYIIHQVS